MNISLIFFYLPTAGRHFLYGKIFEVLYQSQCGTVNVQVSDSLFGLKQILKLNGKLRVVLVF